MSILLQRKPEAKRVYASIITTQTNTDGYKAEGITFPSIESQYRLMSLTQKVAGIHPHEMKYIEAHMTGIPAGDVVESESIRRTFCTDGRKDPLLLGCLKSNLGHTEGASGMCAISKVCLAFENQELPPNINLKTLNPNIDGLMTGILRPVRERMPFKEPIVGVSSFGFGGCNVYTILRANQKEPTPDLYHNAFNPSLPRLVTACGRTRHSVEYIFNYISSHKDQVTSEFLALLNDAMKTDVSLGMKHRGFSLFKRCHDGHGHGQCHDGQCQCDTLQVPIQIISEPRVDARPVWLAISGLSTSWSSLSKSLMNIDPFKESIDESIIIAAGMKINLGAVLFESKRAPVLTEGMVAISAIQIALVDTLNQLDLKVDGIIGHSIGEIVCGYADGCMTREECLWTSFYVSRVLMTVTPKNGSTGLEWDEIGVHTDKVKTLYESMKEVLSKNVFTGKQGKKQRSGRWVSSVEEIIPTDLNNNDPDSGFNSGEENGNNGNSGHFAPMSIPAYFATTFTSKVNFRNNLYLIPKNALVLEISPESILEPALRRGLGPDVAIVPLMKSKNGKYIEGKCIDGKCIDGKYVDGKYVDGTTSTDSLDHLLSSLGLIYNS